MSCTYLFSGPNDPFYKRALHPFLGPNKSSFSTKLLFYSIAKSPILVHNCIPKCYIIFWTFRILYTFVSNTTLPRRARYAFSPKIRFHSVNVLIHITLDIKKAGGSYFRENIVPSVRSSSGPAPFKRQKVFSEKCFFFFF